MRYDRILLGGIVMKTLWKEILVSILLGAVLPGIILNVSAARITCPVQESMPEAPSAVSRQGSAREVSVRESENAPVPMELETYLTGVLLGEVPASFESEALKAQAVSARTYTVKAANSFGKHGDGSLCTDPACCQAYISPEAYLQRGGTEENLKKIQSAVLDTSGMVLTYGGELIEATYFSCSGGHTEDAAAVWGCAYPYLQALDSPGEEKAEHYQDTFVFSTAEFMGALNRQLPGKPETWFGEVTYTPGGGINTMEICGEQYLGTQLRRLLELPSTSFTVTITEDAIAIATKGYGHRVGMSQYGADAMAVNGSTWEEILAYYYPGTQLEQLN